MTCSKSAPWFHPVFVLKMSVAAMALLVSALTKNFVPGANCKIGAGIEAFFINSSHRETSYVGWSLTGNLACLGRPASRILSSTWGSTNKSKLQPILIKQKHAIRIIANLPRCSHTKEWFQKFKFLSIYQVNILQASHFYV